MRLFEQLEFLTSVLKGSSPDAAREPPPLRRPEAALAAPRDPGLEAEVRVLLGSVGAAGLISFVRVEWNRRLRSSAGRAFFRDKRISLNPRLREHGQGEIDRTLRHELAHLVAQTRAGRRRILPHGLEWRQACRELGIADEMRCHTLPFPTRPPAPRLFYRCPKCARDYPRVRRVRRVVACLACCRRHNRGKFHPDFRLRLVHRPNSA